MRKTLSATERYIDALSASMPNLEFATDHSLIYDKYVRSLMHADPSMLVEHPAEYSGQSTIMLVCSQHSMYTSVEEYFAAPDPKVFDRLQRRYTDEWVGYLQSETMPVKEVDVCSAVSQAVFDGLCRQETLESLRIKWLRARQIDAVARLKNLKKLCLSNASSLVDVSPLAELENLEVLVLGQTVKIHDYSALSRLKKLKVLGICASPTSLNVTIKVVDLEFIKEMPSLEYVDFADVRLLPGPAAAGAARI